MCPYDSLRPSTLGVFLLLVVLLASGGGCGAPATREVLVYEGGSVGGPLFRSPERYTAVGIERMDGPMAANTRIKLNDGVTVTMAQATPEFLLARGRIFVPRVAAADASAGAAPAPGESRFEQISGLARFEPERDYIVIIGPVPRGPFYRFDVKGGRAIRFGTEWPGGFLDDGVTLRPAPVFVDGTGVAHEIPFDLETARIIWGPPTRIDLVSDPQQ